MHDASDGPSCDKVIVQVCIYIVHEGDKLSQWNGHVSWLGWLLQYTHRQYSPVKLLVWQNRELRFFGIKSNRSMPHDKVQDDALHNVLSLEQP